MNSDTDLTIFPSIEVIYLFGENSKYKVLSNSSCEILKISMPTNSITTKSKAKVVDESPADLKSDIILNEKATGKFSLSFTISYGPYDMVYVIWSMRYGPYRIEDIMRDWQ